MMASGNLSEQDFLWVLRSVCQLFRIPFSPALVQKQFPPPYERATILRQALTEPGVTPAASAAAEPAAPRSRPALLVTANDTEVVYFEAGTNTSLTLPVTEFESRREPGIMLFAR